MTTPTTAQPSPRERLRTAPVSRRCALMCGAVGATLTACQTYGGSGATGAERQVERRDGSEPPVGQPTVLARVDDIPVGGGTILTDHNLVLTRPDADTVMAFSATCTHQGCAVTDVSDGTINCACHGSKFRVTDGSVADGPARRPLPPTAVRSDGRNVILA